MIAHASGAPGPPPGPYDADVAILSLERPRETLAAIASALAQTGASKHVWVLDQGSCGTTLRALAAAVAGREDATLLASDVNLGVPAGRNALARAGRGRTIAALDNDAEFQDAATLARCVAALDEEPDAAAIGLRILVHATGGDDLSSWGYPPALLPRAAQRFDAATFVGAGHAIRRAAWDAAGGYDPALFFTWEEYDFCLRAIDLGWRVRYRGDIAVRHKVSPEARVRWSGTRWFHYVRNRLLIERRWAAPWPDLAVRSAAYMAKGARNGMPVETARAVAAAWRAPVRAPRRMSERGLAYLARHDGAHRGGVAGRLRREVFSELPG